MDKISQYCQKCRAANEPGDSSCKRCGTPLMLVIYPPSIRHDEILVPSFYEDHLLERVSLLELRLSQMTERLTLTLDLMLKQAQTLQADHSLLKTVVETLQTMGIAENDNISGKAKRSKSNGSRKNKQKIREIIDEHANPNNELFVRLLSEGVKLLKETEEKQAFQMLDRALLLSPGNVALNVFIAEQLFRADKFEAAERQLDKAYSLAPQKLEILLLLGALKADEKDFPQAKQLLSLIAENPQTETVCGLIWGMIAGGEGNWLEALAAFKNAAEKADLPELSYLTGCAYFQLEIRDKACIHLQKAVEKDDGFADAWYMLGVTEADPTFAENSFYKAGQVKETGAQCLEFLNKKSVPEMKIALPFRHLDGKRRLLTGGAPRLSRIFKKMILEVFE